MQWAFQPKFLRVMAKVMMKICATQFNYGAQLKRDATDTKERRFSGS